MNTATKERGILMHARSVNGILAGRKTQTRRALKGPELVVAHPAVAGWDVRDGWAHPRAHNNAVKQQYVSTFPRSLKCPYGQPGDRLWVRETWKRQTVDAAGQHVAYRADGAVRSCARWPCDVAADRTTDNKWRPSLHMPRCYSRITLEITDIRVERVQDISEADALAEGCVDGGCLNCGESSFPDPCGCASPEPSYRDTFISLWDDTNGEGAWDRNDWCWVVEFRRVEQ